jgi:hypothetical protein
MVGGVRSLATIAVALWLGAMGFFAFVSAPAAFAILEREAAGRFVGAVFPRYYLVGVVLGLVALAALLALGPGGQAWSWVAMGLVALMVALSLYAWLVILPDAHAAREAARAGAAAEALRFSRLHRLSTVLNGVVMLAGAAFLVLQGVRR